jgi:hypothetical protein
MNKMFDCIFIKKNIFTKLGEELTLLVQLD